MGDYGVIILAADDSTRLGFPKQLLEVNGESFIKRAVRVPVELGLPAITVLGYNYERLANELADMDTLTYFNLDWKKGIGSSIKAGLTQLHKDFPMLKGFIIYVMRSAFC